MTNINTYIAAGLTALVLLLGSGTYIGWHLYKSLHPVKPVVTNTIIVHDTIPHYINHYVPWYIQGENVIIHDTIPKDIDTLAILHDYYDKHIYHRLWENDTLKVAVTDTIAQNKYMGSGFTYQIKTPFTTINNTVDNSIHYTKYAYAGISYDIKVKSLSFNAFLATPKLLYGVGYAPNTNSFNATLSVKILQIK
jgi:hypothetical protein